MSPVPDDLGSCYACGLRLVASGDGALCTNAYCPGGGRYARCRTCHRPSEPQNGPSRGCWNDACSASPRRERCPDCGQRTMVAIRASRRCTTLTCPSNQGSRGPCDLCGAVSRLLLPDGAICVNSSCPGAWRRVVECAACGKTTFDPLEMQCLNRECPLAGLAVKTCLACRRPSLGRLKDGTGWRCFGSGCPYREKASAEPKAVQAEDELRRVIDTYLPKAGPTRQYRSDTLAPVDPRSLAGKGGAPAAWGSPQEARGRELAAPPPSSGGPRAQEGPPPRAAPPEPVPGEGSVRGVAGRARLNPFEGKTSFGVPTHPSLDTKPPAPPRVVPETDPILPARPAAAASWNPREPAAPPPEPATRAKRLDPFDGRTGEQPVVNPKALAEVAAPAPPPRPEPPAPAGTRPARADAPWSQPPAPVRGAAPPPQTRGALPPAPSPRIAPVGPAIPSPWAAPVPSGRAANPLTDSHDDESPSPFARAEPPPPARPPAEEARPRAEGIAARRTDPIAPLRDAPAQHPAPPALPEQVAAPPPQFAPAAAPPAGTVAVSGTNTIEDALDFLLEAYLTPEPGRLPAPCHLVIGLPGAGKTTYLAMLGEMLLHRDERYHFPFRDLDVRRLDLDAAIDAIRRRLGPERVRFSARGLAPRVRDLVFDFARKVYAGYIARMQWAPATRRDESYFLVSELTKERRPLARIVTLEASGEEYREMLRALGSRTPTPARPSLRVLKRLLDLTEGLIVLVDPSYERNDDLYHTLFLALREDLEPRARNALKRAVREHLAGKTDEPLEGQRLERERDYQRRLDQWNHRIAEMRAGLEARYLGLERALTGDVSRLKDEELEELRELERLLGIVRPEHLEYARARLEKAATATRDEGPVREFYRSMTKFALGGPDVLKDMAEQLVGPAPVRPTQADLEAVTAATDDVLRAAGIPAGFLRLTEEELDVQETERRFIRLKNVAIVVTKTDLYPVIHPPDLFPRQRLPVTWQHLRLVDAYLKLVGGSIQYYNASATGYSVFQDGMFLPGKETTLTPINVIEPIFRMLDLEEGYTP